jgi:hypothetical protein
LRPFARVEKALLNQQFVDSRSPHRARRFQRRG